MFFKLQQNVLTISMVLSLYSIKLTFASFPFLCGRGVRWFAGNSKPSSLGRSNKWTGVCVWLWESGILGQVKWVCALPWLLGFVVFYLCWLPHLSPSKSRQSCDAQKRTHMLPDLTNKRFLFLFGLFAYMTFSLTHSSVLCSLLWLVASVLYAAWRFGDFKCCGFFRAECWQCWKITE